MSTKKKKSKKMKKMKSNMRFSGQWVNDEYLPVATNDFIRASVKRNSVASVPDSLLVSLVRSQYDFTPKGKGKCTVSNVRL